MRPEDFTDILYDVRDDVAVLTINRPERYNAFRGRTVDELITAFKLAWSSTDVAAVVPHRRRRQGVLRGRRREGARRDRWLRRDRVGHVRDRAVAPHHPRHPEARHRRRERRRRRRRPRAARALRPHAWPPATPGSVRAARGSGRSTPASAPPTWPGWSARSAHGRSGSCSTSTTPRPPSGGVWSTRSSRPTSCCRRALAWGSAIGSFSPDRAALPQALVQRRHRPHRWPVSPGLRRARALRRRRRGHGGGPGLRREAGAGLPTLPLTTTVRGRPAAAE